MNRGFRIAAVFLVVGVATLVAGGCSSAGPDGESAHSGTTAALTADAPLATTAPALTPSTTNLPATGDKAELLKRIKEIRAGLQDGTWIYEPFVPPTASGDAPDITVYLTTEATEGEAEVVRAAIMATAGVTKLAYVSRDEVLAAMQEDFKDNPEMLEGLTASRLPAHFELWLRDSSEAAAAGLAATIEALPNVSEVVMDASGQLCEVLSAGQVLDDLEEPIVAPDISVYLEESVDEAAGLYETVKALPGVARIAFVSREEAFERLEEEFQDAPEILEGLEVESLSASLEIWLADPQGATAVEAALEGRPEVEEVRVMPVDVSDESIAWMLGMFHEK